MGVARTAIARQSRSLIRSSRNVGTICEQSYRRNRYNMSEIAREPLATQRASPAAVGSRALQDSSLERTAGAAMQRCGVSIADEGLCVADPEIGRCAAAARSWKA